MRTMQSVLWHGRDGTRHRMDSAMNGVKPHGALVSRRDGYGRSSVQLRSQTRKLYAERFAPQRIFERAGIYARLDRLLLG